MTQIGMQRLLAFFSASWFSWIMASVFIAPNVMGSSNPATGNAANGKVVFEKRCTGCHSLDKNKEGPRLGGVYGRKAGSLPDFNYSSELRAANINWDAGSLNKWLTNPDALVPDTDMAFHVPSAEERADIIQFLRLSSGK